MLSTLLLRKAGSKALASVRVFSATPERHCAVVTSQEETPQKFRYQEDYPSSANIPLTLEEKVTYWKKANDIFFGPERDVKNFPHPEYNVTTKEEYNFGFIPTRWFKAMYPQLGVSGAYTLFWGTFLFGLSKEVIVMDHEWLELIVAFSVMNYARLKWGKQIAAKLDTLQAKRRADMYEIPLQNASSGYLAEVNEIKQEISRQDAIPVIFHAKQEQLELQLETQYRQRLEEVYETVRRRLDYQADMEHAERTYEQHHMVNWIVNGVQKAITPQQEKDSITSCIRTLKNLSATAVL